MTDVRIYTTDKPLAPGKVAGQWTASGKVKGMGPKNTIWRVAEAAHGFEDYTYLRSDYPTSPVVVEPAPEPTPTPTPAPKGSSVMVAGYQNGVANPKPEYEAYGRIGTDTAGFTYAVNRGGSLGAVYAPAKDSYRSYRPSLSRAGLFVHGPDIDLLMHARAINGFTVGYTLGGKKLNASNQLLTGYNQNVKDVTYGVSAGGVDWAGTSPAGLRTALRYDPIEVEGFGAVLRLNVTLTNTSAQTLTGVRFVEHFDFDSDGNLVSNPDKDAYATDNSVPKRGTVLAGLRGTAKGHFGFLHSTDPRAVASYHGFVTVDAFTPQLFEQAPAVGSAAKSSDATSHLGFLIGDMAPGASTTLTLYMGHTKNKALVANLG